MTYFQSVGYMDTFLIVNSWATRRRSPFGMRRGIYRVVGWRVVWCEARRVEPRHVVVGEGICGTTAINGWSLYVALLAIMGKRSPKECRKYTAL